MHTCEALVRNSKFHADAIGFVEGEQKLSWGEMMVRVQGLANGLRALGCRQGEFIGMYVENALRVIEVTYAVQLIGCAIVPLNTRWMASEISLAIEDAGIRVLVSDKRKDDVIEDIDAVVKSKLILVSDPRDSSVGKLVVYEDLIVPLGDSGFETIAPVENAVASLFYTGGTTGRSKGVKLTHANHVVHSMAVLAETGLNSTCRYLHAAPMFHIADALFLHVVSLRGAQHVILPRFETAAFAAAIIEHAITDTILVPTMIQAIFNSDDIADKAFSNLKRLYYGASPMPEVLMDKILERFPDLELVQLYGQTEASPVITILAPEYHNNEGKARKRLKSAGRPMMATNVRIVSSSGDDLPVNGIGEIIVTGPQVMDGYLNRPEETAGALQGGWLHTGDVGYLDADGFLYITDRVKDMIITGGENVYSIEVEQVIYDLAGVAECCVVGLPHEKWGEIVHAIVVPKPDFTLTEEMIKVHCKERLADYKRPKTVAIRIEALPLSGAGKVLKRELRDIYKAD